MQHSQEAAGRFILARGQPTKLLGATKKAFDFVALAVAIAVNNALNEAVFLLVMTTCAPRVAATTATTSVS